MKRLLVSSICLASSAAIAEDTSDSLIDRWIADTNVYVTKTVRNEIYFQRLGCIRGPGECPTNLDSGGRPITTRQGDLMFDDKSGKPGEASSDLKPAKSIDFWLEKYPVIRIVVQPAPPRDYKVSINGQDCPATEKGLYKVPIGIVDVRIQREGKPPCVWSGRLTNGGKQEVACNF